MPQRRICRVSNLDYYRVQFLEAIGDDEVVTGRRFPERLEQLDAYGGMQPIQNTWLTYTFVRLRRGVPTQDNQSAKSPERKR